MRFEEILNEDLDISSLQRRELISREIGFPVLLN